MRKFIPAKEIPMLQLHPYLFFGGNCREAMSFYKNCIGGELKILSNADVPATDAPPGPPDAVMHATLQKDNFQLMGSDGMPDLPQQGNLIYLSLTVDSVTEAERVFQALSKKGKVNMPLQQTFWATRFGMLQDPYGFNWMINCEQK